MLCSSVVVEYGQKKQNICKNRLYEYDADETWVDVLQELLKESNMSHSDDDFEPHKTDTFSVTVSDKLSRTPVFTPDIDNSTHCQKFRSQFEICIFQSVKRRGQWFKKFCQTRSKRIVRSAFDVLMQSCNSTKALPLRIKKLNVPHVKYIYIVTRTVSDLTELYPPLAV